MAKQDTVLRATGKSRTTWFGLLDKFVNARPTSRTHREIAAWLRETHGVRMWWAQKLTVEYELARGMRKPGERSDRTFSVGASRTIAAPLARVFRAFASPAHRRRWMPEAGLRVRSSTPNKTIRFDWDDGTRVMVAVVSTPAGKTQVAVEHERIVGARAAAKLKTYWRAQVDKLKAHLES